MILMDIVNHSNCLLSQVEAPLCKWVLQCQTFFLCCIVVLLHNLPSFLSTDIILQKKKKLSAAINRCVPKEGTGDFEGNQVHFCCLECVSIAKLH